MRLTRSNIVVETVIVPLIITLALLGVLMALAWALRCDDCGSKPNVNDYREFLLPEGGTPEQGAGLNILSTYPEPNYGLFEQTCFCGNEMSGTYINPNYQFTCNKCGITYANAIF